MKFIKTIFENNDIRDLAVANEELANASTSMLINYNLHLEQYVQENLDQFVIEGDLSSTYENIRNNVISANIAFMSECAAILSSGETDENKIAMLEITLKGAGDAIRSGVTRVGAIGRRSAIHKNTAGDKVIRYKEGDKYIPKDELYAAGKKRLAYTAGGLAALGGLGAAGKYGYDKYKSKQAAAAVAANAAKK
jgi:hypothetical protein